jgi:ACS family 4-hydroxyphenylacetate permease-like MFS transporter
MADTIATDVPAREDAVVRKVGRRLTWFLFLLYIFAHLDRINVGFAALSMNRDLALTSYLFGLATTWFNIGYLLCDVPSNLMLVKYGARIWIPRIMISWGLASIATMFAVGPVSLFIARFLVGAAEAGFLAGVLLYISYWYPTSARGKATGIFLAAAPVTIAFGAPLSGLILEMDGYLGLAGWRWLFLLEGVPSVILGVIAYYYLTDNPRKAHWLTDEERELLLARIERERKREPAAQVKTGLLRELSSPTMILLCLCNLGLVATLSTNAVWTPQIVSESMAGAGYFAVGLVTAGPALAAALVLPFWTAHSDRRGERIWHTVVAFIVAAAGWVCVMSSTDIVVRVAGLTLVNVGSMAAMGVFWTLPGSALSSRASPAGIAMISMAGIVASLSTPPIVGLIRDRTDSFVGGVGYGLFMLMVSIAVLLIGRATRRLVPVQG